MESFKTFTPHPYQQYCINRIVESPTVGLFLDMGLGKTAITLMAIRCLRDGIRLVDAVWSMMPLSPTAWKFSTRMARRGRCRDEAENPIHLRGLSHGLY